MAFTTKSSLRAATGMSIGEHLREARRRILISFAAILLFGVVAFVFYTQIFHFLAEPYCATQPKKNCHFLNLQPLSGLSLRIKIGLFGGFLLASPVVFYQIWRFITPGLKAKEKKYAVPFLSAAVIFFLGGAAMGYYSFGHALKFLQAIGGPELQNQYEPNSYLSLITLMIFAFGLTFEFPVVLVSLELAGAVTPKQLLSGWRYAIIAIAIAAAVFTPSGDPFSMFALMIPLVVFYFGAIGVGKLLGK
jgi:sec-independent protein translocase protein TatC